MYKLKQGYQRAGLCKGAYPNRHEHIYKSTPLSAALCSGVSCIPKSMGQAGKRGEEGLSLLLPSSGIPMIQKERVGWDKGGQCPKGGM